MYFDLQENGKFQVDNSYEPTEDRGRGNRTRQDATGWGSCPNDDGHCWVSLGWFWTWDPNYKVVDTDYDNYSIVYSCDSVLTEPTLWILSRDPVPNPEDFARWQQKARDMLPNYDFNMMGP